MTETQDRPDQNARAKVLPPVRVSDDERARIKANAAAAGLSVSAYVRQMALSGRVTVRRAKADPEAVRLLLIAGNNINQLAKSGHQLGRVDLAALHDALAEIRRTVERLAP